MCWLTSEPTWIRTSLTFYLTFFRDILFFLVIDTFIDRYVVWNRLNIVFFPPLNILFVWSTLVILGVSRIVGLGCSEEQQSRYPDKKACHYNHEICQLSQSVILGINYPIRCVVWVWVKGVISRLICKSYVSSGIILVKSLCLWDERDKFTSHVCGWVIRERHAGC